MPGLVTLLQARKRGWLLRRAITVKLKDKNMTSWLSVSFLCSQLPLYNLHTSITFTLSRFSLLLYTSASLCILQVHCCSSPLFFHTLLIISVVLSLLSLWDQSNAALLGCVKSLEAGPGASDSHSCVTSATSQPSTTGHDAPQPSDLWACCVATSAVSPTLTSRPSHIAPKYRAASPNLHGVFDLRHGYCLCPKWIFVPCFLKYLQRRGNCCSW